jgi:hypothetical protein
MATERDYQRTIVDAAVKAGWFAPLHVRRSLGHRKGVGRAHQTTTSRKGWPDLTLWRPDVGDGLPTLIFVELKANGGVLSPDQRTVIRELRSSGQHVYVWDLPDDFDAADETLFAHRHHMTRRS